MEDTREQFNVTLTLSGGLSDREVEKLVEGLADNSPAVAHEGEVVMTVKAWSRVEALISAAYAVQKYLGDVVVASVVTTEEFDKAVDA